MSLKFVRQLFIFSMLLKRSGFFLVQHMQFEVSIMFKAQMLCCCMLLLVPGDVYLPI